MNNTARSGASVEFTHVFRPAADAETTPTLLLLHGTGGDENDLVDLGRQIAPSANLLGVRGQVIENGMPRFFRRLAEGVFDEEDLRLRTHELADWIAVGAAQHGFDVGKVYAVGFSNGANIAASLLLLRPGALTGAILLRPMVPLTPKSLPDLAGVPVLISAGRHDPLVSTGETERLAELLRKSGASVTTVFQPAGHGLALEDVLTAADWAKNKSIG